MIKKQYFAFIALAVILLINLTGCKNTTITPTASVTAAIAQIEPEESSTISPSPTSSGTSAGENITKIDVENKREAAIKSLVEYSHIKDLYSAFANNYAYLGVNISEDYISEGDSASCLIVYVYGKEDWCVETRLNEKGIVSFGLTMPISFAAEEGSLDHVSALLSDTSVYYGVEITPDDIKSFIQNSIEDGTPEKTTSIGEFKAIVHIEDDYISINLTK